MEAIEAGNPNETFRREWVKNALLSLPAGLRILDAGAGEQQYRPYCSHLNYISQDFAEYNPASNTSGLQMSSWDYGKLDIISDITQIPEPDASFDAILCTEVLEHVPDPLSALRELSRLLKPGGYMILTAPFCSMTHFAPFHYSTGFSRYFYEYHLPKLGMRILKAEANGNYHTYLNQELSRLPFLDGRTVRPGRMVLFAIQIVQRWLKRTEVQAATTSSLLCFGWHILAEKAK